MSHSKLYVMIILLLLSGLWLNNTSWLVQGVKDQQPRFLSHRGVHQTYAGSDRSNSSCSANPVNVSNHTYIENTVVSMRAAFEHGADVVELDIHLTTDNVFAVFHDWRLECRTDGTGVTEEKSYDYLQSLDIAYGYTVDGVNFPLRGSGVGKMPSLTRVFDEFPDRQFLLNFKSKRTEEGAHLAKLLENENYRKQVFGVYGGSIPTSVAITRTPGLRGFDRSSLKACLKRYALFGWTGWIPSNCSNTIVAIPVDYAKFLWGWPHKFTERMGKANTAVILWAPYDGSGFSSGFDSEESMKDVPDYFSGYIWTNKIELFGKD